MRYVKWIEVALFCCGLVLCGAWALLRKPELEPWVTLCGLVSSATGIDLFRRYKGGEFARSPLQQLQDLAEDEDLSTVLPRVIRFARQNGAPELEHWANLEYGGYYSDNGLREGDTVPEYRQIGVQYYDQFMRMLPIPSQLDFLNLMPLSNGVGEIESWASGPEMMYAQDEGVCEFFREKFNIEFVQRGMPRAGCLGLLHRIRAELVRKLADYEAAIPNRAALQQH